MSKGHAGYFSIGLLKILSWVWNLSQLSAIKAQRWEVFCRNYDKSFGKGCVLINLRCLKPFYFFIFFDLGTVLSTTKRLSRVVRKCLAASDTVGNTASIFTLDAGSEAIWGNWSLRDWFIWGMFFLPSLIPQINFPGLICLGAAIWGHLGFQGSSQSFCELWVKFVKSWPRLILVSGFANCFNLPLKHIKAYLRGACIF